MARAANTRRRDIAPIGYEEGGVAPPVPAGGEILITDETNALGIDFAHATDAQRVAVKFSGIVSSYGLDAFFQNGGTGPKMVYDATGTLAWSPHNMFLNSGTPATQSVTTVVGQAYTVTVTGTGTLTGSSGASGVASAASPLTYVATGVTSTFTLAGSLTTMQMNIGRAATAYLATTAARRYGLAIDNDPTLGRALLVELGVSNLCLWSNDLTQAAWVKSNLTTAYTASGPEGFANTATTITATAANATALQTITHASTARMTSVFLKRRTGTGNVDITQDNGTTWATQAITSTWARYSTAEVTSANPTVGIRLVTSGDAVDVAIFQNEATNVSHAVTSPYPTFSLLQTRAGDNYTFLLSTIPALGAEYSMYARFSVPVASAAAQCPVALTDGTANEQSKFLFVSGTLRLNVIDGGVAVGAIVGSAASNNVPFSAAARFKLNDCAMSNNGGAAAFDTTVTMPAVTEVRFGGTGTNAVATNVFRISKLVIVTDRGWSNAELVTKSTA